MLILTFFHTKLHFLSSKSKYNLKFYIVKGIEYTTLLKLCFYISLKISHVHTPEKLKVYGEELNVPSKIRAFLK